jgi:hypothetical protein
MGQGGSAAPAGGDGGAAENGGAPNLVGFTCADDIIITNDAELAEFARLRCRVLGGDLEIASPSIRNLDALDGSGLEVIGGSLNLVNNAVLDNVSGLRGLRRIEKSLGVVMNGLLTGLEGLEKVERIGNDASEDSLVMMDNQVLSSLEALGAMAAEPIRLHTRVMITYNPVLPSLRGLTGLQSTQFLMISNNTTLTEIGGLTDLFEAQNLDIHQNEMLETCDFPILENAGNLTVSANPNLESVSLPDLAYVFGTLTFTENWALKDVGTLDELESAGQLVIRLNPLLPQCFVDALGERLMTCVSCELNDFNATCD